MKLVVALLALLAIAPVLAPATPDPLDAWYRGFNHEYFQDNLPENVYITHNLSDDRFRAVTVPMTNGWYHIDFNPRYGYHPNKNAASTSELMDLLHESCHVWMFAQDDAETDDHGPHWQYCMHHLAQEKAFDNLW